MSYFLTGAVASGFLVLIAGYSLNVTVVVICMSLAGLTTSLAFPAYTVNMLDIAPRYSSIIMGVCNTVGTTAGFVSPTIVGFITQQKVTIIHYICSRTSKMNVTLLALNSPSSPNRL